MTIERLVSIVVAAPAARHAAIVRAATAEPARPKLVTRAEAAASIGVHPRTLARYVRPGLVNERRVSSRMIRYDLGEVERLVYGDSTCMQTSLSGGAHA